MGCKWNALLAGLVGATLVCQAARGGDEGSIAQYLQIRTPGQVRLSPDGRIYFRDWPNGVNQLFRRERTDAIDAQGARLTSFPDGITRRQPFRVSPDGRWVIVPADLGGNEDYDLYLLDTQTDALEPVLVDPTVRYTSQVWLRDSTGFIYTANADSPNDFFIYRYDIASGESTLAWGAPGFWFVGDVRDDGAILAVHYRSIADTALIHLLPDRGEMLELSKRWGGRLAYNAPIGYMPDRTSVLMVTDANREGIRRLYRYGMDSRKEGYGEHVEVLPDLAHVEFSGGTMNLDRSLLAVTHNESGYNSLRLYSLPDLTELAAPEIERGVVSANQIVGRTLIYSLSNARTPGVSYAYHVPADDPEEIPGPRPLSTRMDDQDLDVSGKRLPELIRFESFDGLRVPAYLYLPEGFEEGSPVPFVIQFHGGPEGQARPSFNSTIQFLVDHGYGVMVPNVRGSTGYGRKYHQMDNYRNRWDSVRDGAEAARWLVKSGYAEAGRIAAYGGSYGGFMAVATVIEGADVFGASVDVVGIVNFRTFLERTRGYRRELREAEYGPLTDPVFLESISPLNRAGDIQAKMLIAHGLNDPRVPVDEAMQLAEQLQKLGRDPELIFFHDEGHGFAKLDNRILFGERMVRFLDRTIGPDSN